MITRADHIKRLTMLRDVALASRKVGAAVQCEIAIGRASGFHQTAVEDGQPRSVYQMSDDELMEIASGGREERP